MGGYHVTGRTSSGGDKYIGLESVFQVPTNLIADTATTTYPEFIYSFWRGATGFGMDVGIGYGFPGHAGKWVLFAWGKNTVVDQWQESPSFYLNEGEEIMVCVSLDKKRLNSVIAEIKKGSRTIVSKRFSIVSDAYKEMIKGCTFTRECLLASNGNPSEYVNCGAQFKFAKWYWGSLFDINGNDHPFVGSVLPTKDDHGLLYRNKVCTYCIDEVRQGDIYGCECATASFTSSLSGLIGDFTCVTY